jgi:DNA polymerase-4
VPTTIVHVDMDAFYAAVEVRDRPELASQPLIVGGAGRRGVVASCSYEARAYGVHSAMPSAQARRLCPHAVFLAGRFDRYREVSQQIHEIFTEFTPAIEPIALDEAFLDVRGAQRLFGAPAAIAWSIRGRIDGELGLSASVGVAPNKVLAKLASEAAKPRASLQGVIPGRGVVVVEEGQELAFLHPHPIEALWGVGPVTAERLRRLGVSTVGQLAAVPVEVLERAVGKAHGSQLHDLAQGRDDRAVEVDREVKSVSHEETYATDRFTHDELHSEVIRMADAVASRLRAAGLAGRTVTVKVRFGDFTTITRSHSVPAPVDAGQVIGAVAQRLVRAVDVSGGVRLLGVGVSSLSRPSVVPAEQLALTLPDDNQPGKRERGGNGLGAGRGGNEWADAAVALDAVRRRFGDAAVAPAALVEGGRVRVKRPGDTQWGPAQ